MMRLLIMLLGLLAHHTYVTEMQLTGTILPMRSNVPEARRGAKVLQALGATHTKMVTVAAFLEMIVSSVVEVLVMIGKCSTGYVCGIGVHAGYCCRRVSSQGILVKFIAQTISPQAARSACKS